MEANGEIEMTNGGCPDEVRHPATGTCAADGVVLTTRQKIVIILVRGSFQKDELETPQPFVSERSLNEFETPAVGSPGKPLG